MVSKSKKVLNIIPENKEIDIFLTMFLKLHLKI